MQLNPSCVVLHGRYLENSIQNSVNHAPSVQKLEDSEMSGIEITTSMNATADEYARGTRIMFSKIIQS